MTTRRFPCVSVRMCRLRPVIIFSPIEAPLPAGFGRFDGLTVDDPGTRLGGSSCLLACSPSQHVIDLCQGAIKSPGIEIVADRVPVGEIGGQETPLTAGAREI